MRSLKLLVLLVVACSVVGVGFATKMSQGAVTQGKTRPMLTKQWMKGVMGPHCSAIGKGLKLIRGRL